jgi:ABC-type uncharacterized transport system involved in gliding motility auxiliary subunit
MTDLDKLTQLLDSWGVPHKPCEWLDDGGYSIKVGGYTHQSDPRNTVDGYNGFFTLYNFDAEGKFVCTGAWE